MTPPIDTKGAVEAVPVAWQDAVKLLTNHEGNPHFYMHRHHGAMIADLIESLASELERAGERIAELETTLLAIRNVHERLATAERERDEARSELAASKDEIAALCAHRNHLESELAEVRKKWDFVCDWARYEYSGANAYWHVPCVGAGTSFADAVDGAIYRAALSAMREEK